MDKGFREQFSDRNDNEILAISLAQELIDKFEVFDKCIVSLALDEAGIDLLLVKRMDSNKDFRFHIQHKSSKKGSHFFTKYNPCIPVWIVNKSDSPHEAIISLLNIIVEKTSKESKNHQFFAKKLQEIKKLYKSKFDF